MPLVSSQQSQKQTQTVAPPLSPDMPGERQRRSADGSVRQMVQRARTGCRCSNSWAAAADIESRLASAQQHIRDEGITYTIYADPQGKVGHGRWMNYWFGKVVHTSYGLAQRARLINRVLADTGRKLLHQGIIPPEVFLGPAAGFTALGWNQLIFFCIVTQPIYSAHPMVNGGSLPTSLQAPSGAGYLR